MGTTFLWKHALQLHSTLSPFSSPFPITHQAFKDVQPVSWRRLNIAGLLVTIYGLDELPADQGDVACIWLLHGRSDSQDSMGYVAGALLDAWKAKRQPGQKKLICIAMDQRNHGSRMVDDRANVSWKQGNPTHGPDMFNLYSGTASDVSHLLDHIPSYLPFPISEQLCAGISLGGHATWILLANEPRIRGAIIVIGCPDYVRLMTDRAYRSKLPSAVDNNGQPDFRKFLGSPDFPPPLLEALEQRDPAGIFLGELDTVTGDDHLHIPSESEQRRLRPLMTRLAGKKIICLSGGKDRLVPYKQGQPFIQWLQRAVDRESGWFNTDGIEIEDIVDEHARHEFSGSMRKDAERWLCNYLATGSGRDMASKL